MSILEKEGKEIAPFWISGEKKGFQSPCGVAVNSNDCIFVAEGGNHQIQYLKFIEVGGTDETNNSESIQFTGPN